MQPAVSVVCMRHLIKSLPYIFSRLNLSSASHPPATCRALMCFYCHTAHPERRFHLLEEESAFQTAVYEDILSVIEFREGKKGWGVGGLVGRMEVCMETPNGYQWKINCGQKSLVSIKSPCIIKVSAAGKSLQIVFEPLSWGSLFN